MEKFNLRERQLIALNILKEIKRVCEVLEIRFYLAYGTLLGAARHKGFIPWDDDIDILMPEKDFKTIIDNFNSVADKRYRLYFINNTSQYPFAFPKVIDTTTECREKCFKKNSWLGIWVDIFPLYNLPSNWEKTEQEYITLEKKRWCALYSQSNLYGKTKLLFFSIFCKKTRLKDLFLNPSDVTKKMYSLYNNIQDSAFVCAGGSKDIDQHFNKSDFDTIENMIFEGEDFPCPAGWNNILKKSYGDYMKLPPLAKRQTDKHLRNCHYRKK